MFTIKRNQVIISALVVMIAVAGYLSYIDRTPANDETGIALTNTGEVSALVVDDATGQEIPVVSVDHTNTISSSLVESEIGIALTSSEQLNTTGTEETENTSELGEAVFVNSASDSSFFVQAKLDREQSRAKRKEVLTEMINSVNLEKEQKAECATALLDIQSRVEKETAAEAMIEAKGFTEAYVRIDDETVDVVVDVDVLSDAEIAQIEDIVKRKTGMSVDQIRISPLKEAK